MRNVTFYHRDTGDLHHMSVVASDDTAVELNTPAEHVAIDHPQDGKQLHPFTHKVNVLTGEAYEYRPPQPTDEHEWDDASRRWQLNAVARATRHAHNMALHRIRHLETHVQPRAIRELVLGYDGAAARLRAIDDEILKLRPELSR